MAVKIRDATTVKIGADVRKPRRDTAVLRFAALGTVLVALLGACTDGDSRQNVEATESQCSEGNLVGAGATFQQNAQRRWINDFTTRCDAATVSYDSVGSGKGIERFVAGTVDFAGSDAVLTAEEQTAADLRCSADADSSGPPSHAIHLPIVGGAVVFLFNLPGLDSLRLSATTVAGLLQQDIGRWDDPRVARDNPGVELPAVAVVPVRRLDSSGTTDVLSRYMQAAAGDQWRLGVGKELPWPEGVAAADGSDAVAAAVAAAPGGFTYAELSFAAEHGLPTAAVLNAGGAYVKANAVTGPAALESAELVGNAEDVRLAMNFTTPAPTAYPASTVTYVIVCDHGNRKADLLRSYLTYVLADGQLAASTIGYIPVLGVVATRSRRAAVALN